MYGDAFDPAILAVACLTAWLLQVLVFILTLLIVFLETCRVERPM